MPAGPKLKPGSLESATVVVLREAIDRSDFSDAEIARRVEISKSQLSRILRGIKPLTMTEFDRICSALGLVPARVLRAAALLIEDPPPEPESKDSVKSVRKAPSEGTH